jgi:serine protease Do
MLALLFTTLLLSTPDCNQANWQVQPVVQLQQNASEAGYLGVSLLDLDVDHARKLKLNEDRGVEIRAVMEGGPADKAGIQPGDVVLSYNGETVLGAQQLSRLVQETPAGRKIKIQYWRDGKAQTAVVTLGSISMGPTRFQSPPAPDFSGSSLDFPTPLLMWYNASAGLEFERVDSQLAGYFGVKNGVLVRAVLPGSPAEKAGLKAGDVIFSVAQQTYFTDHEVSSLFRRHSSVAVSVMRDHKRVDLMLYLP